MPFPVPPWRRWAPAALVVAALVVAGPAAPSASQDAGQELGQQEAAGDRDRLEAVGAEEVALLADLAATQSALAQLDTEIAAITAREQEVTARLVAAQEAFAAAQESERRTERQLERQRQRLRSHAIAVYASGGKEHATSAEVLAMLDADQPLDVSVISLYGGSVVATQDQIVSDYIRAENQAARARADARRHRDAVQAERDALEVELQRRAALRATQEAQRAYQEKLLIEVAMRRAQIEADVAAEAAESDAIGTEIAAAQVDQPLNLPLPGSLVWLLPSRPAGSYSSAFGMRHHPILGTDRLHKGADVGCATDDPIVAVADGTVLIATVRGGYGNTVVIDHGGQFSTLYAHNARLDVVPGQVVTAGTTIAACGSTGLSTGPHSHFETRVGGGPIDPTTFL